MLNLAIQEAIKEAIAGGGQIKTVQDSLRMSRTLYTIMHKNSSSLYQEACEVLQAWPD